MEQNRIETERINRIKSDKNASKSASISSSKSNSDKNDSNSVDKSGIGQSSGIWDALEANNRGTINNYNSNNNETNDETE